MLAQQSDYTATAQKDVVTVSKFLYKSNKTEIPCGCVCVWWSIWSQTGKSLFVANSAFRYRQSAGGVF